MKHFSATLPSSVCVCASHCDCVHWALCVADVMRVCAALHLCGIVLVRTGPLRCEAPYCCFCVPCTSNACGLFVWVMWGFVRTLQKKKNPAGTPVRKDIWCKVTSPLRQYPEQLKETLLSVLLKVWLLPLIHSRNLQLSEFVEYQMFPQHGSKLP